MRLLAASGSAARRLRRRVSTAVRRRDAPEARAALRPHQLTAPVSARPRSAARRRSARRRCARRRDLERTVRLRPLRRDADHERHGVAHRPTSSSRASGKEHPHRVLPPGDEGGRLPRGAQKPNCPEGWYELVQGGFVCAKFATLDPNHPKVQERATPARSRRPLPYDYGINLRNGTPMYKKLPSWRAAHALRAVADSAPPRSARDPVLTTPTRHHRRRVRPIPAAPTAVGRTPASPGICATSTAASRDVTLDDLEEDDPSGPIERRMVKGFYSRSTRTRSEFGAHWWKTIDGHYVPVRAHLRPADADDFHGIWLNQDPPADFNGTTVDAGLPPLPARRIDKLPSRSSSTSSAPTSRATTARRWSRATGRTRFTVDAAHRAATEREPAGVRRDRRRLLAARGPHHDHQARSAARGAQAGREVDRREPEERRRSSPSKGTSRSTPRSSRAAGAITRPREGPPDAQRLVPHPREAHRGDDGRRHGERTGRTRSRTSRRSSTSTAASRSTARSGTPSSAT